MKGCHNNKVVIFYLMSNANALASSKLDQFCMKERYVQTHYSLGTLYTVIRANSNLNEGKSTKSLGFSRNTIPNTIGKYKDLIFPAKIYFLMA